MNSGVQTPPRTMMEVYKMLPEGTLAELIDNTIFMSPPPIHNHQKIVLKLAHELLTLLESQDIGEVFVAPYDVYLDETNAVQPDITLVLNSNLRIIDRRGHIHGVPDLLIEILSPSNKEYDLVIKKNLYEKMGVKEYWIIDADDQTSECYIQRDGRFTLFSKEVGRVRSSLLNAEVRF